MSIEVEPSQNKLARGQSVDDMPYRQHFTNNDYAEEDDPNLYLEDDTDDKDQRLVVRIVPKFIDYAIFLV